MAKKKLVKKISIVTALSVCALAFFFLPLEFSTKPVVQQLIENNDGDTVPVYNRLVIENNTIIMTEENFSGWLAELYTNVEAWEGKKIRFSGSVWKNTEKFANTEFALVRMMMVCCASDMEPAGILVKWDNADTLNPGDWIEVTGVIAKTAYAEGYDPIVYAKTAKKIPVPKQTYIYP